MFLHMQPQLKYNEGWVKIDGPNSFLQVPQEVVTEIKYVAITSELLME